MRNAALQPERGVALSQWLDSNGNTDRLDR